MQLSPVLNLDQLKEKYMPSELRSARDETKNRRYSVAEKKNHDRTSHMVSRPTTNSRMSRRLSTQNSKIFSNRQSFRDIVLKAADHKPFLERLDSRSRNRLAGVSHQTRLEKFRHIATRWQSKAIKGAGSIDTLPEVDYEVEMPEKPRFCATLSTEAQYAIFKGYEDVLVDKISSSLPSSEKTIPIKRIPSAAAKPRTHSSKSTLPILENKPNIVLSNTSSAKKTHVGEEATSARLKRYRDQRYMSTHFKQAMNILDELKRDSSTETSAAAKPQAKVITVQQNIRQYHAWSQRWARHFEFSC